MREIRPYGSARGVRSNPYPYRDQILPVRSTAFLTIRHTLSPTHPTDASLRGLASPAEIDS